MAASAEEWYGEGEKRGEYIYITKDGLPTGGGEDLDI